MAPNENCPGESAWVVYDISVAGDELCVVGESDVGGTSGIGDEEVLMVVITENDIVHMVGMGVKAG